MTYFLKKKKWLAWVVMLTFLFTSFMPSNIMAGNSVAEAASAISLTVGGSREVSVDTTKDVSWSSSNSNVATVNPGRNDNTATVKATGTGTATITAGWWSWYNSYKNKSWVVTVTDNTTPPEIDGNVIPSKAADRIGPDEWKITMSIGADSQIIEAQPLNIVLVLDRSNSMTNNNSARMKSAKAAAKNFVEELSNKKIAADVAVVDFNKSANIRKDLTPISTKDGKISTGVSAVKTAIGKINTTGGNDGGTNIHDGLIKAKSLLAGKENAYIVLLSDGLPTHYITNNGTVGGDGTYNSVEDGKSYAKSYVANQIKPVGIKLITIAFDIEDAEDGFYAGLASDELDFNGGINDLDSIFKQIQDQILYVMSSGIITDSMEINTNSDVDLVIDEKTGLPKGCVFSTGTVRVTPPNKFVWTITEPVTRDNPATLTYTVKAKSIEAGQQQPILNGKADLDYKNSNGEDKNTSFTNPTGKYEAGKLVVSYDGLPENIFPIWTADFKPDKEGVWASAEMVTDWPEVPANVKFPRVSDTEQYQIGSVTVTLGDGSSEELSIAEFNTKYSSQEITLLTGISSIVYHYATELKLTKVDGDNNNAPMSGVTFTLKENQVSNAPGSAIVSGTYLMSQVTGNDGQAIFKGLETGKTYTLTETVPEGYKANGPWTITVNADGTISGLPSGNQIVNVRTDQEYTVNYLEKGTNNVLKDPATKDAKYAQEIAGDDEQVAITGYSYDSVDPVKLVVGKDNKENVINVYYVKDASVTKELSYTVEYYKDGKLADGDTDAVKKNVWINDETLSVDKDKINVTDKYVGYKFKETNPTEIPANIADKGVIKVYYVKDDSQKQDTIYTVKHVINGIEQAADTKSYEGTAWINEKNPTIVVANGSLAHKTYEGYKFDSIDTKAKEGDAVASGTVITLSYVKDDSQKQDTIYTVKHVINGIEQAADTKSYEGTAWINEKNPTIVVANGSLAHKTYEGYKFDSIDTKAKEGDAVASGTVITLSYVKDDSQKQDTIYTVKHVVDGVEQTGDTKDYEGTAWINEKNPTIVVANGSLAHKTYEGYKFDNIDTEAKEGDAVPNGTVIILNYVKDDSQTKDLKATVDYSLGGKIQDKDRVNLTDTVQVLQPGTLPTEGVVANNYTGWTLSNITINGDVVDELPAVVKDGDVVVYNYVLTENTAYTVNYLYQNPQTGEYELSATSDTRTTTSGAIAFITDEDAQPQQDMYRFNTAKSDVQKHVVADGSTVLNVYFDALYNVVYKYTDGTTSYTVASSGHVYHFNDNVVAPGMASVDQFDGRWYKNEAGTENEWAFDTEKISANIGLVDLATHTLYLYTAAKVTPLNENTIRIAKDAVNAPNADADYTFNLKLIANVSAETAPVDGEVAEQLQKLNAAKIEAEGRLDAAQEALIDAENAFGNTGFMLTTGSSLSFVMFEEMDDYNDPDPDSESTILASLYSITTGSAYEFHEYNLFEDSFDVREISEDANPDMVQRIVEFIEGMVDWRTPFQTLEPETLLAGLNDAGINDTDTAIAFGFNEASDLYLAAKDLVGKEEAYTEANEALQEYMKQIGRRAVITINGEQYTLDAKDGDGNPIFAQDEEGNYILNFDFSLKAGAFKDFEVTATTGSTVQYIITETYDADDMTTTVNGVSGKTVEGLLTSGSAYTFVNTFGTTGPDPGTDPDEPTNPPTGGGTDDSYDGPYSDDETTIPDQEVPLAEPVPEEPVIEIEDPEVPLADVPGETVEPDETITIDEPEVPLGDAPRTGDENNTIPFIVLMMLATAGMVITRRKFN